MVPRNFQKGKLGDREDVFVIVFLESSFELK